MLSTCSKVHVYSIEGGNERVVVAHHVLEGGPGKFRCEHHLQLAVRVAAIARYVGGGIDGSHTEYKMS